MRGDTTAERLQRCRRKFFHRYMELTMTNPVQRIFADRLAPCGILVASVLLLALGSARWVCAQSEKNSPAPYASIATDGERYAGPGRESAFDLPEPVLHIALLVPLHGPEKADGETIVAAAQMALRDASQRPMPGGRRLALAIGDESGPSWGLISDVVMRLVFDQDAVALITSTSGTDAHVSEQVGNRIGVPILTLSADATTTQIDIPWIFRVGSSDVLQAQVIARNIYRDRGLKSVLMIVERDHDGQSGAAAMRQAAQSWDASPPYELVLDPLQPDFASVLTRIQTQPEQAMVLWTGAETAGKLLRSLRAAGIHTPTYLSQQAAQAGSGTNFSEADPSAKTESNAASLWTVVTNEDDAATRQSFARRYQQAMGMLPSPTATEAYDTVCLTVRALRAAGPNRARVRDQLAKMRNFPGASGTISFDREGNNPTLAHLVRLAESESSERKHMQREYAAATGATQP